MEDIRLFYQYLDQKNKKAREQRKTCYQLKKLTGDTLKVYGNVCTYSLECYWGKNIQKAVNLQLCLYLECFSFNIIHTQGVPRPDITLSGIKWA